MLNNIKLFYWLNFFIDFRFYTPIAILYFSKITGSYALGMSIFSVTMFASAIFEVPTGIYSDFIGRKKTILFGSIFLAMAVLCYALGFSYLILVVGAILEGISRSFYSGNNNAMLYDTLKEVDRSDQYHEILGKSFSSNQLAAAVSAVIGSIVALKSLGFVFWISTVSPIFCIIICLFFKDPQVVKKESTNIYSHLNESFKLFVTNKKLRYLSISGILSYGIGESGWFFRSAFIQILWPVWAIGIAQTISNMVATLSFYYSGRIINKFNEYKLILTGEIYAFVINIISLVFPTVFSPLLMTTSAMFFGTSVVAEENLKQKSFTDHQRATMGSLDSLGQSIFFGIYSIFLGFVADRIGPINALLVSTILTIPVMILYYKSYKS